MVSIMADPPSPLHEGLTQLLGFKYRKNSDNKPWAYICSKGFTAGLIFEELIFGGACYWKKSLRFQMGLEIAKNTR